MASKVVVTGIGIVSTFGHTMEAFWEGIHSGPPTVDPEYGDYLIDRDAAKAEIRNRKNFRRTDPNNASVVLASQKAADMAGGWEGIEPESRGLFLGATAIAYEAIGAAHILSDEGEGFPSATMPSVMANSSVATVAIDQGCKGPVLFTGAACASGNASIHLAFQHIASGQCEAALAGGFESLDRRVSLYGMKGLGAISETGTSRPFDVLHNGVIPSEGAVVLLMETEESALRRGATILAEIAGTAVTCDAFHHASPEPDGQGQTNAMAAAVRNAGLEVSDISMIVSHGNGTPTGDTSEAIAMTRLLAGHQTPITTYKGATGHTWAASGAMNTAFAIMCMKHRELPGVIGFVNPIDEVSELDIVAEDRTWEPGPVLTNSFGFGGHNACVVAAPYG